MLETLSCETSRVTEKAIGACHVVAHREGESDGIDRSTAGNSWRCRAVPLDHRRLVPGRIHRGGFGAAGVFPDGAKADWHLGSPDRQCTLKWNKRGAYYSWLPMHPTAEGNSSQDLHGDSLRAVLALPRYVPDPPRPGGFRAFFWPGMAPRGVLRCAYPACHSGGFCGASGADHDLPGMDIPLHQARAHRPVDLAHLALCLVEWRHRVLDALPSGALRHFL